MLHDVYADNYDQPLNVRMNMILVLLVMLYDVQCSVMMISVSILE